MSYKAVKRQLTQGTGEAATNSFAVKYLQANAEWAVDCPLNFPE